MNIGYYGRCMNCGEKLPPPSAGGHSCVGVASFLPPTAGFGGWSEAAIRAIAREVVREELAGVGKNDAP